MADEGDAEILERAAEPAIEVDPLAVGRRRAGQVGGQLLQGLLAVLDRRHREPPHRRCRRSTLPEWRLAPDGDAMRQAGFVTSVPVHDDSSPSVPPAEAVGTPTEDLGSAAAGGPAENAGPAVDGGPAEEIRSAAAGLGALPERPLAEHVEVYEELHARLQAALRSVD